MGEAYCVIELFGYLGVPDILHAYVYFSCFFIYTWLILFYFILIV